MRISLTDKFLWDIYNVLQKTGDTAISLLSPSFAKYYLHVGNPVFDKYRHNKNKAEFRKLIYYAKKNRYIRVESLKGSNAIMLTKEGLGKVLRASFVIEGKQKRKDGKWIMLIFDVPEKEKRARDLLRSILHNLEYKLFQKSVWISPYDVSDKTEALLQMHSLDNYVKIFLIEEL